MQCVRIFRLALVLYLPSAAAGAIVDRLAVSAGGSVITLSDIDQRIRLAAYQNNETADFSLASRKQAAQELIDQRLVQHEMDLGHYPRLSPDRGNELVADYARLHYRGDTAALDRALTRYGLTESDLAHELLNQADLLTFLDLRFGAGLQPQEDRVPGAGQTAPEQGHAKEQQAAGDAKDKEATDKELDSWLAAQRTRTRIDYVEPELKP